MPQSTDDQKLRSGATIKRATKAESRLTAENELRFNFEYRKAQRSAGGGSEGNSAQKIGAHDTNLKREG